MNIREAYEDSLHREGHDRDPAQEIVVDLLAELQQQLHDAPRPAGRLRRLFRRPNHGASASVPGLYIWGGVGRGKTFLMDLFFDTLRLSAKRRIHFHRMMHDVHDRLRRLGDIEDPLDTVAGEIARNARVLCFDEFFVSDIGDAMILARLLDGLFCRNVTLVTTSNAAPDDLYRDGLQRQRFLPAIELLKTKTRVVHMEGDTDYRLRLLQKAGTYLTPDDEAARARLEQLFAETAFTAIRSGSRIEVNGRRIRTHRISKGIAWFEFGELCDGPRSQLDYIEIARWYPTVILSGVPQLTGTLDDQARRFVALIDEFYDRRVKLIVSAAVPVPELYAGVRLVFEFERTKSRLVEMQSRSYLAAPHMA